MIEQAPVAVPRRTRLAVGDTPVAPTVAAPSIPAGVTAAPKEGDTPWTGEAAADAVAASSVVRSARQAASVDTRSRLPDRPWGDPLVRLGSWATVAVVVLTAAILLIVHHRTASIPAGVVTIVALARGLRGVYVARLEARITRPPRGGRRSADEPPKRPSDAA